MNGAGLPIGELHARVLASIVPGVRRSDIPSAGELERLLRRHVDRGEVEHEDGAWKLTPLGRSRFGGLPT